MDTSQCLRATAHVARVGLRGEGKQREWHCVSYEQPAASPALGA